MELKEAIEILKDYADWTAMLRTQCPDCMGEAIKIVLAELDKQKQVKAEMRKVAWEEGYNQGYIKGVMESI